MVFFVLEFFLSFENWEMGATLIFPGRARHLAQ